MRADGRRATLESWLPVSGSSGCSRGWRTASRATGAPSSRRWLALLAAVRLVLAPPDVASLRRRLGRARAASRSAWRTCSTASPASRRPPFTFFVTGDEPGGRAGSGSARSCPSCGGGRGPARRLAAYCSTRGRAALLPVAYPKGSSQSIDEATRLRHEFVQTTRAVQTRVLGEPAVWSNFQQVAKHQLARGEEFGFPLILLILLAAFGTVVAAVGAARARLRRGLPLRRGRLLALALGRALGLRHEHGLDDRDRRRGRLLPLHRQPLPRGAARRAPTRRTRCGARSRPPAGRSSSAARPSPSRSRACSRSA